MEQFVDSVEDEDRIGEKSQDENELALALCTTHAVTFAPTRPAPATPLSSAADTPITRQEFEELLRATMNQILAILKESKKN